MHGHRPDAVGADVKCKLDKSGMQAYRPAHHAMLSPTSLVLLSALSYALTAAYANAPGPCTVKAWVRADDLAPNAISHGELKVKLTQPCGNTVQSVTLRLRLDEYAEESVVSNKTTSGEFWDWQGDAPRVEWISTKHKRTAFMIEKTLPADGTPNGEDWGSGVVFPFSVVSPNVNYPAAIHPLLFTGSSTENRRTLFGLGYRYTALVTLTGPNGVMVKNVEVPAGFTAFRPSSMNHPLPSIPRDITLEALGERGTWTMRCVDGELKTGDEVNGRSDVKKMTIRVTLPSGGNLVQGSRADITVTVVDSRNADSSTRTVVSGFLELSMVPTSKGGKEQDPPGDDDDDWYHRNRLNFQFKEFYAQMWRSTTSDCNRCETPIAKPLLVTVPDTFPRTAPNPAISSNLADPPFHIKAYLSISVTEYYHAPHMEPLEGDNYNVFMSGEWRKAPATEVGWEFDDCDRAEFNKRSYTARIPVGIVGASHTDGKAAMYYLENGGRVPVPRISSGHLSSTSGVSFDVAVPVSVRETVPATIQGPDMFLRSGHMESIDARAGHYVGALWQSRLHGPRASPSSVASQIMSNQVFHQV